MDLARLDSRKPDGRQHIAQDALGGELPPRHLEGSLGVGGIVTLGRCDRLLGARAIVKREDANARRHLARETGVLDHDRMLATPSRRDHAPKS